MRSGFTFASFFQRFIFALILVFVTFNPSEQSFYHWVVGQVFILPILVLIGVLLMIGWAIFLRATMRSLGFIGVMLASALFGCMAWIAIYYELLVLGTAAFSYIILVIVAAILGLGMSWSHVRRRLSGQADVDDVDQ